MDRGGKLTVHSGFLHKQYPKFSFGLQIWQKRWFILQNRCLLYFREKTISAEQYVDPTNLGGVIPIADMQRVTATKFSEDPTQTQFVIVTASSHRRIKSEGYHEYILQAGTTQERDHWVMLLASMIHDVEDDHKSPGISYADTAPQIAQITFLLDQLCFTASIDLRGADALEVQPCLELTLKAPMQLQTQLSAHLTDLLGFQGRQNVVYIDGFNMFPKLHVCRHKLPASEFDQAKAAQKAQEYQRELTAGRPPMAHSEPEHQASADDDIATDEHGECAENCPTSQAEREMPVNHSNVPLGFSCNSCLAKQIDWIPHSRTEVLAAQEDDLHSKRKFQTMLTAQVDPAMLGANEGLTFEAKRDQWLSLHAATTRAKHTSIADVDTEIAPSDADAKTPCGDNADTSAVTPTAATAAAATAAAAAAAASDDNSNLLQVILSSLLLRVNIDESLVGQDANSTAREAFVEAANETQMLLNAARGGDSKTANNNDIASKKKKKKKKHSSEDKLFSTLGSVDCSLYEILSAPDRTLKLPFSSTQQSGRTLKGVLTLTCQQLRRIQVSNTPSIIHRSFCFHDRSGRPMLCHEKLQESPFAFAVPRDLLAIRKQAITRSITAVEAHNEQVRVQIGKKPQLTELQTKLVAQGVMANPFRREQMLISSNMEKITQLKQSYANVDRLFKVYSDYQGTYKSLTFKPSHLKKDKLFRYIATNLHQQTFTVHAPADIVYNGSGLSEPMSDTTDNTLNSNNNNNSGFDNRMVLPMLTRHETDVEQPRYQTVVYDTTTVGAFAAHALGFGAGGMQELVHGYKQQKRLQADEVSSTVPKSMEALYMYEREAVVMSQAMSTVATVFAKFLLRFLDYPTVLIRTLKCGFLVEVESLLSTFSTEDDMISDNLHAAGSLGHVVIRIEQASSSPEETEAKEAGPINQEFMLNQIKVTVETRDRKLTKQEQQQAAVAAAAAKKKRTIKREFIEFNEQNHVLVIVLHVPSVVYRRLPVDLKKTSVGYNSRTKPPKFISIVPIVISQGVNEMQSAANMLQYVTGGNENNDRQTNINIASMLTLVKYFQVYETYLRTHKPPVTASVADSKLHTHDVRLLSQVKDDMKLLNDLIDSSTGHKQVQILCKARCIVRRLRGGRVVMCKSAKDRTSMSVTWENAHTLTHHYDVSDNIVTDRSLLGGMQLMRAEGVRRANAFKNTGKKYYCFNSIQRRLLPGVLRPVDSVCGNVQS